MGYATSSIYRRTPGIQYSEPKLPKAWMREQLWQADVADVTITVHAPDQGEALLKIMAIALEYDLARL